MSKRPYRKGHYKQGQEVGGCLRVIVYVLLIYPVIWLIAKLRGKSSPKMPDWIVEQ